MFVIILHKSFFTYLVNKTTVKTYYVNNAKCINLHVKLRRKLLSILNCLD